MLKNLSKARTKLGLGSLNAFCGWLGGYISQRQILLSDFRVSEVYIPSLVLDRKRIGMRIGFLVNPIAGMGGKVGLKGTDGVLMEAIKRGATTIAPERGVEFLEKLKELSVTRNIQLITCPKSMGEQEICSAGLEATTLQMKTEAQTTSEDTKIAVRLMVEHEVDLILFVGGDGTARDILDTLASTQATPVLGVPAGVKMYSGVFAVNPAEAAYVVEAFVNGEAQLADLEVMDADEAAIRNDRFNVRLYGFLKGPFLPLRVQGSKQVSSESMDEHDNQVAAAQFIVEGMNPRGTYILGPGSTVKCVAELLRAEKTLLGVDIYANSEMKRDVNEETLLKEVQDWRDTWIIVSPIGRQGILFGRGNQQISPKVIRLVGREKIVVLATKSKIQSIEEGVLRVDTGDSELDHMLKGYIRVATDYREWRMLRIV
jgi:predicted polyphosphate/ATP-dependent NAD kinase